MEPDPYEIPEGFFGPFSPELPALIGRVVMLSALLETKVWQLAGSIDNKVQEEYAMSKVSKNIALSKKRLTFYEENDAEKKFALTTLDLLDNIDEALRVRNIIIHGVWTHGWLEQGLTWKPVFGKKRGTSDWIEHRSFSRHDFLGLIAELIQLVKSAEKAISDAGSIPRRAK